jgi:cytochrome c peroxidase
MRSALAALVLLVGPAHHAAAQPNAQAELGRYLFFDERLSSNNTVSCATCHAPASAFADPRPVSLGVGGAKGTRNAPTVLNRDRGRRFFWDGRASSLEQQAEGPILNAKEMAHTREGVVKRLQSVPEYAPLFERAYGDAKITFDRVTRAIAAYERALTTRNSPYDRYLKGDKEALSPRANLGRELFFGKANCAQCHAGPDFTNEDFVNVGAGAGNPPDEGRRAVTLDGRDWRLFKVPTLREIARTAPYMHDGSLATLADVVEFYDRGGDVSENKDYRVRPLNLTAEEKAALVAFLESLSGTLPSWAQPPAPLKPASPSARR